MSLHYENLDSTVRSFVVREIEQDQKNGILYISRRLTDAGAQAWFDLLRDAADSYDDAWLANALRSYDYMRTEEQKRKKSGEMTTRKVPHTAPDTLAEGEFNRFYARGLCAAVLASGGNQVEVYRGKEVTNPRAESEDMIGQRLSAQDLLHDLRSSQGVEPALGLPPGPNSGLTIRRI